MNAGQGDNTVMCTSGNDSQNLLEERFLFTWMQVRVAFDFYSSGTASVDLSKSLLAVLKLCKLLNMVAFICLNIKQLYLVMFLFTL